MKKIFLIGLFLFLSTYSQTFACGTNASTSQAISNNQKACKNVVSFIFIDFSFLSPRATAADINAGTPKHCMPWMNKCCTPQCSTYEGCPPQCYKMQTCPQTCAPQCCPCTPKCPDCRTQSMVPDDIKKDGLIPVTYIKGAEQQCANPKNKTSMFRIDLFRHFKFQIL